MGNTGEEVWPKARDPRGGVHWIATVLDTLPTRLQPQVKRALHEMMSAENRAACEAAMQRFAQDYEAKYPKATKALGANVLRLLTHFDFPAAHWKHIWSTNPIESTFATMPRRTRVTKGAGSRVSWAGEGLQVTAGRTRDLAPGCAQPPAACPSGRSVHKWAQNGTDRAA